MGTGIVVAALVAGAFVAHRVLLPARQDDRLLAFLLVVCFTLATSLQLRTEQWSTHRGSDSILKTLLGDGRRMFAYHFYVKADVYFHSGYYPSIFDQAKPHVPDSREMKETHDDHDHEREGAEAGTAEQKETAHEKAMNFLGQPKDWIDRFGRNFYSSKHSHLDSPGQAKEILPWLRISADLDPERIETYTVAAFWLREKLNRVDDAEQFLREGLRANPNSYEIYYELGDVYYQYRHKPEIARNIWDQGLARFLQQDKANKNPDVFVFQQLTTHLAHVAEELGKLDDALEYRKLEISRAPPEALAALQKQSEELKQKIEAAKIPPQK